MNYCKVSIFVAIGLVIWSCELETRRNLISNLIKIIDFKSYLPHTIELGLGTSSIASGTGVKPYKRLAARLDWSSDNFGPTFINTLANRDSFIIFHFRNPTSISWPTPIQWPEFARTSFFFISQSVQRNRKIPKAKL